MYDIADGPGSPHGVGLGEEDQFLDIYCHLRALPRPVHLRDRGLGVVCGLIELQDSSERWGAAIAANLRHFEAFNHLLKITDHDFQ